MVYDSQWHVRRRGSRSPFGALYAVRLRLIPYTDPTLGPLYLGYSITTIEWGPRLVGHFWEVVRDIPRHRSNGVRSFNYSAHIPNSSHSTVTYPVELVIDLYFDKRSLRSGESRCQEKFPPPTSSSSMTADSPAAYLSQRECEIQ